MHQNTGTSVSNKWVGPKPVSVLRIRETGPCDSGAASFIPCYPFSIPISDTIDWVFMSSIETAATTRKVGLIVFNRDTMTFDFRGCVILTFPSAGNHTVTAFRVVRYLYTSGNVSVSGTAVTGNGTGWKTARYSAGARMGFGSTDPTEITDWYNISQITDDTNITLEANAGTVAGGTPFVIEELQVAMSTTNSTVTNGGLFLAKGLNFSDFAAVGKIIPAAVSTDNVKSVYWLKNSAVETNTISSGMGMDTDYSDTSHFCYVLNNNTTTTLMVYKYDIRKALASISSGATTEAFVYSTGVSGTMPTLITLNASRLGTLGHGPGVGDKSIYVATSTRVYRISVSSITEGNTSFIKDSMTDIPPGYTASMVGQGYTNVDILDYLDRLITFGAAGVRAYLTRYNTENYPQDHVFGCGTGQYDGSSVWPGLTTPAWSTSFCASYGYVQTGMAYIARTSGSTLTTAAIYAIPIGAHWDYAASKNQRVISPALNTPGAELLSRLYVNNDNIIGSHLLGTVPDPYRVYVRTSGIDDNSGSWTRVEAGDLSKINPGNKIQVMFEFKMLGVSCVGSRIHSVAVVYQVPSTDNHFSPTLKFRDNNARFSWKFTTAFGTTVPILRVRIYDADSGTLLSDDNTDSSQGVFEKSTDAGVSWTTWNNTDKGNETTYVRYTYRPGTITIVRSRLKAILSLS